MKSEIVLMLAAFTFSLVNSTAWIEPNELGLVSQVPYFPDRTCDVGIEAGFAIEPTRQTDCLAGRNLLSPDLS
jgi:hypothetical protein